MGQMRKLWQPWYSTLTQWPVLGSSKIKLTFLECSEIALIVSYEKMKPWVSLS
jgi:hypothetical protein